MVSWRLRGESRKDQLVYRDLVFFWLMLEQGAQDAFQAAKTDKYKGTTN